jgi:rRNA maturation endonuclease Nob1
MSTATITSRRFVGLERHYHCHNCDRDRRSWKRLESCPDCGDPFAVGVIRRAATQPTA